MSIKSHGTLRGALRAEVPWQKLYEHRHRVLGAENEFATVMPLMPSSSSEAV